jgi:hypothetical protein
MCVARFSCPQLLDAALRASQHPVDHKGVGVGVGCYLGRDPGGHSHQRGRQPLAQAEHPLVRVEMAISTRCLSPSRRSDGSFTRKDAHRRMPTEGCPPRPGPPPSTLRFDRPGPPREPPRYPPAPKPPRRGALLGQKQTSRRRFGGGEFVGEMGTPLVAHTSRCNFTP